MSSIMATLFAAGFQLKDKLTEEETEKNHIELLQKGETPTPAPKLLKTRCTENANGRIFYANEDTSSGYTVFYIHGGGYQNDFSPFHWLFLKRVIEKTDAMLIAPAYRLVPFATWKEAFDLILPVYQEFAAAHPEKKIILMGDSAGGGLSLALAEQMKLDGIRLPDEIILLSPWVDATMENPDVEAYAEEDPWLSVPWLKVCGRSWAGDRDPHDYQVSPINGDMKGLNNITVFSGTKEVFYPDLMKFFELIRQNETNELIIGKDMMHVFPLMPIPEAKPACEIIFEKIMRAPSQKPAEAERVANSEEYRMIVDHYTDKDGKLSYDLLNKDMIKFSHSSSKVRKMLEEGKSEEEIRLYVVGTKFRNITGNKDLSDEQILKMVELLDEISPKGVFKEFNEELRREQRK